MTGSYSCTRTGPIISLAHLSNSVNYRYTDALNRSLKNNQYPTIKSTLRLQRFNHGSIGLSTESVWCPNTVGISILRLRSLLCSSHHEILLGNRSMLGCQEQCILGGPWELKGSLGSLCVSVVDLCVLNKKYRRNRFPWPIYIFVVYHYRSRRLSWLFYVSCTSGPSKFGVDTVEEALSAAGRSHKSRFRIHWPS